MDIEKWMMPEAAVDSLDSDLVFLVMTKLIDRPANFKTQ